MKKILMFILPFIFFISCTSAPKQSNYPLSFQPHMQSASHWSLLAKDFSLKVAEVLEGRPNPLTAHVSLHGNFGYSFDESDEMKYIGPDVNLNNIYAQPHFAGHGHGPVYIDKRDQSVFGKAFRTMLITELWRNGIEVVDNPEYAYSLSWGCQRIYHENERNSLFSGIPLLIGSSVGYLLVGGDLNPQKPHWEILITLNLHENKNQLLRKTIIKYVNGEDVNQYRKITDSFIEPVTEPMMINYMVVGN